MFKELVSSFGNAFRGLNQAWQSQTNLRIQVSIAFIAILGALVMELSVSEIALVVFAIGLVLATELLNTIIEKTLDIIGPDYSPEIGAIKDMAASAALVSSVAAAIVGAMVFLPHLL